MNFRDELAALIARHVRGIPEGESLDDARSTIKDELRHEADRQLWLGFVERLKAEGYEFFQLTADVLNPKPDGRKCPAFRRQQLWNRGSVFVGQDNRIGQISPGDERSEDFVMTEAVPANIAEAIYRNSRKLTMAEAIEQHDEQKAAYQAAHEERCRKWNEEEEAEEKDEQARQEALDILERMKEQ